MKQETLEEAAERVAKLKYGDTIYGLERVNAFTEGAKYQSQKMYSEEDLKEAFKVNYTPFSATNIGDFDKDWNKWFEQVKKKL